MANDDLQQAVASIREMVLAHDATGVSDTLLLKFFVTEHDEAAFEALVRRHGPMVLGVCRRVLQNPSDAEDAFQATFLVFVRKADSLTQPELLGNWLHGVAFHTARSARAAANRRRKKEGQVTPREIGSAPVDMHDLLPVLDKELDSLPAKYRTVLVLCDLEQKSRKEVARALDLPEGTLASRLARGRALLAKRLRGRGVTLGGAALTVSLGNAASAPSSTLVHVTVKTGTALMAGQSAALGLGSASAVKLSETVIKMMLLNKLKWIGAICLGGALCTAGVGALTAQHWRSASTLAEVANGPAETENLSGEIADKSLFQQILVIAGGIEDPNARLDLLLRIARAQLEAGDKAAAFATLEDALKAATGVLSNGRKARLLSSIAMLQNSAGEKRASRETVQQAENFAFAMSDPPSQRINALIAAIQCRNAWAEYDECLRIAAKSGELASSVLRNMAMTMQPGKGAEQIARQALTHAAEMLIKRSPNPNERWQNMSQSLGAIAAAQVRIGFPKDAMQILEAVDTLQHDGRLEDLPKGPSTGKVNAIMDVARAQVQSGDLQGALETVGQQPVMRYLKAELLRQFAQRQVRLGDFQDALETSKGLNKVQEKANILYAIAVAQIEKGDRMGGQARLEELRRLNESLQDTVGNSQRFSSTLELAPRTAQADIEACLGDFQDALKTAGNLTAARDKAQSLLAIARQMRIVGRKEEAKQTLRRASRSADRIPEQASAIRNELDGSSRRVGSPHAEKGLILYQIAEQQAIAGDAEGAFETTESLPPNSDLDGLVIALAEGDDLQGAIESLAKLTKTEAKERALEAIARIMTKTGKEQEAAALAAKQNSPLLKAYTLLGVALGKAKVPGPRKE